MRRSTTRYSLSFVLIAAALGFALSGGCPAENQTVTAQSDDAFAGTLQDGVAQVPSKTLDTALQSVSADGTTLTFDAAQLPDELKEGNIVLLSGVAGGRVTAIATEGDVTTVTLEPVAINELVKDGTLAWEAPIAFDQEFAPKLADDADESFAIARVVPAAAQLGATTSDAGTTFMATGEIEGWETSLEMTPASGRLDFTLTATRAVNGVEVVAVAAEGNITNFMQCGEIAVQDGETTRIELANDGLRGEVELRWVALNPGEFVPQELTKLRLPVEVPVLVQVGPIPVTIKIRLIARVLPLLSLPDMSSRGSLKIEFSDADAGFRVVESSVAPFGAIGSSNFTVTDDTISAGAASLGVGIGLEFPRVEVGVLGGSAVAFISYDTYAVGSYEPGLFSGTPACQSATINYKAFVGYELSLLGFASLASDPTELWRAEDEFFVDGTPCGD